jgi:hypothetical protein
MNRREKLGFGYPKPNTTTAVRRALEKAGIVFVPNGTMGEGVQLARPVNTGARK